MLFSARIVQAKTIFETVTNHRILKSFITKESRNVCIQLYTHKLSHFALLIFFIGQVLIDMRRSPSLSFFLFMDLSSFVFMQIYRLSLCAYANQHTSHILNEETEREANCDNVRLCFLFHKMDLSHMTRAESLPPSVQQWTNLWCQLIVEFIIYFQLFQ